MFLISIFKKSNNEPVSNPLLVEIEETKGALCASYANFENVVEPDLVDSCIYEMKAVQLRYKFLLNQLKELKEYSETNTI